MAAAAEQEEKPQQRERGTLKDTLPRRPIILIALICIISALLATALFVYSSPITYSDWAKLVLVFIACLGSASTSVGIIFGDSLSHIFAFGIALLFIHFGVMKSSITAASPPLILAALASTKLPRAIISSLDSSFLLKPITLQACCLAPFLTLIHQSIVNPERINFSTIPTCFVVFMTLLLMYMYNKNRSHKNGCLLTTEMKSQAIFAGISMLLSCSIVMGSNPDPEASTAAMTVFLLGSLFAVLMSYTFASVADVWYTIGSGQFQMVSLDTVGIMLYFICPAVILHLRFLDRYGESIASKCAVMKEYLQSTGILSTGDVYGEDIISFSLVMTLAMVTSVGVPLLNALCPMGGNLFSRAYTHGQPNTKKVAVCVNFSDLPKEAHKRKTILDSLEKNTYKDQTTAVLNIFVTLEDLTLFPEDLKMLAKKGHVIALTPSEFQEAFCGLSMFEGNKASCNLQIAHHEYSEIFGKEPSWISSRSADSVGRHPSLLREASDLGMKIAYWSTLVQLTGGKLTNEQKDAINSDCADKNGGSIIFVTLEKAVSSNAMQTSLSELINTLDGYSMESLSDVAKDEATMVL
mmetsp:Transcript_13493/g.29311  ORF Transcript_13493/g.29311 Transcript_13493/m.29311 type:complete len:580 (+) Transcript_13493:41-1780(+)